MAKPPLSLETLIDRYGPHLNYVPPGGWRDESRHPAERLVKTHCCFCGQQCGLQLKVRGNHIIGFEPWEEFPFNRGMLCPKGVKRYLQDNHPDRLLDPLLRTDSGFRTATWDEALDFTARRLREIQEKYGKDAVAIYGGAAGDLSYGRAAFTHTEARADGNRRRAGAHCVAVDRPDVAPDGDAGILPGRAPRGGVAGRDHFGRDVPDLRWALSVCRARRRRGAQGAQAVGIAQSAARLKREAMPRLRSVPYYNFYGCGKSVDGTGAPARLSGERLREGVGVEVDDPREVAAAFASRVYR